jgi:hypothetical protein
MNRTSIFPLNIKLNWYEFVIMENEKKQKKHNTAVPPYVPAKSKALKNISGSSNDSTSGGIKVKRYGRGRLCPVGSFSTENFTKWKSKIFKKQNINHSLEFRFNKP